MESSNSNESTAVTGAARTTKKGGFASMDPARQREIAKQGGIAAHQSGNAHEFTSEEGRAAAKLRGSKQKTS